MNIAIIVISAIVLAGLLLFFICRFINRRAGEVVTENGVKVKRGFKDVKAWFINHIPSKRRLIQVYAALLFNANIKGYISGNIYQSETSKYMCVPGLNCYSCPGAVGACPLGALQNALAESNTRAPYYILGILALFGLTLARTICGFLCPIGLCQDLLYKVRTPKLKKSRVTRVLSYFKYVLLALLLALPVIYAANLPLPAFCKYICPAGTFEGAILLLANPHNSNMFVQLGWQFTWKFSLLVAFIVAAMFIYRVFCRFFCPLGAIYGFFNKFAIVGVHVEKSNCTDCGLCVSHCKMDVKRVGDHECINCGECISVCPTKAITWKGSSIFLRGKQINAPAETIKPIAVSAGVATVSSNIGEDNVNEMISSEAAVAETRVAAESAAISAQVMEDNSAVEVSNAPVAVQPVAAPNVKRKKRPLKFWLEVAAWSVALVVLVVALVLYNFVDRDPVVAPPSGGDVQTGNQVGDIAPDFTVELYGSDGSFNLYAERGKVTVINFWATWCTPCVEEIPFFNEFAVNHPDIGVVAIHGAYTGKDQKDGVTKFIADKGWNGYELTFAQDNLDGKKCLTFSLLGGTSLWPMTVVVDAEGKIVYNSIQSFSSYEELNSVLMAALQGA